MRSIRVWELPVRLTHWSNVISIVGLSITGYYIGQPFIFTRGEGQYLMATVRFVHILFGFAFTAGVLFRVYWAFAGNRWASWRQLLPLSRDRLLKLRQQVAFYAFWRDRAPAQIGHNPLAGVSYIAVYVLFFIQILTGFGLYSQSFEDGAWPLLFGWQLTLFGASGLRLIHAITMWALIAFTIHHVYSAVLIDVDERSGLLSSIVTGYKTFTTHHLAEAGEQVEAEGG